MATERFEARAAPDGLALVQDLVNTHAVARDGADLLADHETAQHWLEVATDQWASVRALQPPELSLSDPDLQELRELRTVVQDMLAIPPDQRATGPLGGPNALTPRAPAQLISNERGQVALVPLGADANWLASAVWSEILLAQHSGAWTQIKLCREPGCRTAFYDTSRNSSGIWHNVRTCGNITNLRASRARKKSQTAVHN